MSSSEIVRWFNKMGTADVPCFEGENALLGEMMTEFTEAGVGVPESLATTTAFPQFVESNRLADVSVSKLKLYHKENAPLTDGGRSIRSMCSDSEIPRETVAAIRTASELMNINHGASADATPR